MPDGCGLLPLELSSYCRLFGEGDFVVFRILSNFQGCGKARACTADPDLYNKLQAQRHRLYFNSGVKRELTLVSTTVKHPRTVWKTVTCHWAHWKFHSSFVENSTSIAIMLGRGAAGYGGSLSNFYSCYALNPKP